MGDTKELSDDPCRRHEFHDNQLYIYNHISKNCKENDMPIFLVLADIDHVVSSRLTSVLDVIRSGEQT